MNVRIVSRAETGWTTKTVDESELIDTMKEMGFPRTGTNFNSRQRAELQNKPKFDGFHGPMWDGDCLRYENYEAYTALSA